MKPINLVIEGLNSFETKQELDFTKLGDGVFGIFGKTGSGKSTILDAITLALYGEVGRSKQNIDFINTKCKKANVSLLFEIYVSGKTKKYKVCRTFSVRKNGKDVESTANLYEIKGENENLIYEGVYKVNEQVFRIVGLGQNEFSKCIALPQGEFSAFLKAKQSERTEIMSNIFDLSKYGEKLCEKVRKKVSELDKQVTALSASLELVEYANDEVLTSAKTSFKSVTNSYETVKKELLEKNEIYAKASSSLEKRNKLLEIEEKLKSLNKKKQEIEKIEREIERNQSANDVKSDYENIQKCRADERELSEKISELNEAKLKAQSDHIGLTNELNEFRVVYNAKLVELNSKLGRISELTSFEDDEKALLKEEEKIQEDIAILKQKIAEKQEEIGFLTQNIEKIDEEIEKINDFIEANKTDVNLSYALEQTKGIESELILIDDFYTKLEKLIDQTNDDLKAVQEEYNSAIAEEKSISETREKIQNSIQVAFEEYDTTDFKKLRSCDSQLEEMREVQVLTERIDELIEQLSEDSEKRLNALAEIDEEITISQNNLTASESEITDKTVYINKSREEREEMLGDNFFALVSNHLNIGENCPICGGKVLQKNYGEVIDIKSITSNIESASNELKSQRFERDKIFEKLISLETRRDFERIQIENNNIEIQRLSEEKEKLYQRFVDVNDKSKENFDELYDLILNTANSLEALINLQNELRDAELRVIINKTQSGTKVTIYRNYLESLIDVIYDLQKKKAEREFAIYNMNEKFENLNEYKKQIAEGKSIELVIDSKKEEKYTLRENQYKITGEKAVADREMAVLNSELNVQNEKLANVEKQITNIKSKIAANGVPEGVMVSEEQHTIKEAIAKLGYDLEQKEQALTTSKDHLSRTENEYNVTYSILADKRSEIIKCEAAVNSALKDGEFSGHAELENYFISGAELKAKQNIVNDFNGELRLAEIQKQELENEDIQSVSEAELKKLKDEIEQLSVKVQKLSESVGRQGAEYSRLEEDNKKRKEILSSVDKARKDYDLAKELSLVLKGKALAEYVAEEFLQEITVTANQKLNLLMDGRYNLKFMDKDFYVEDNFNDGLVRPAGTLSGGETFLVSLSLAFAISDAISLLSSRNMEFFFLDEGFGTLDAELCEAVVSALYKLESQNLKIGLISHVAELEESIKNRVYVTKTNTGSKIRLEHSL